MEYFVRKLKSSNWIKRVWTWSFTSKEEFLEYFFASPDHQWIVNNNQIKRSIEYFFSLLSDVHMEEMLRQGDISIVLSNDKLACTVRPESSNGKKNNVILVFPKLHKFLKSAAPNYGLAVLAHELGHLILRHRERSLTPLNKQIEADEFACKLGFERELVELLEEEAHVDEVKFRLHHLYENLSSATN